MAVEYSLLLWLEMKPLLRLQSRCCGCKAAKYRLKESFASKFHTHNYILKIMIFLTLFWFFWKDFLIINWFFIAPINAIVVAFIILTETISRFISFTSRHEKSLPVHDRLVKDFFLILALSRVFLFQCKSSSFLFAAKSFDSLNNKNHLLIYIFVCRELKF